MDVNKYRQRLADISQSNPTVHRLVDMAIHSSPHMSFEDWAFSAIRILAHENDDLRKQLVEHIKKQPAQIPVPYMMVVPENDPNGEQFMVDISDVVGKSPPTFHSPTDIFNFLKQFAPKGYDPKSVTIGKNMYVF